VLFICQCHLSVHVLQNHPNITYAVKKVELEMVWEQSYLNPHKFITHVWVGLGKSSCLQIYVTALLPALSLLFDIAMLVPLLAD